MTLAVGCKIPWSTPGTVSSLRPNEVVFLLADTRWTYPEDARRRDDEGRKIFRLHKQLAAVYAGDVPVAERAIQLLTLRLKKMPSTPADAVGAVASDVFSQAFQEEGRPDVGLWVLVGGRNPSGHAFLIYLSHEAAFMPIFLDGHPFPIGPEEVCQVYRASLEDHERQRKQARDPLSTAYDWLTATYSALDHMIQSKRDPRIGGKIQTAIVDESGMWEIEYLVLDEVRSGRTPDKWRRPSRKLSELRRYHA